MAWVIEVLHLPDGKVEVESHRKNDADDAFVEVYDSEKNYVRKLTPHEAVRLASILLTCATSVMEEK